MHVSEHWTGPGPVLDISLSEGKNVHDGVEDFNRLATGARTQPPRVVATRLFSMKEAHGEISLLIDEDYYSVGVVLRRTSACISVLDRALHNGLATPGLVYVTAPGLPASCRFVGPYDTIHLKLCARLISESAETALRAADSLATGVFQDQIVERLARSLVTSETFGNPYGQIYADSIGRAIVARILALQAMAHCSTGRAKTTGLVKWRLKRALDYIEVNLSEQVGLARIAAAAGLTRMHFAAQFRAATGLRPHEYVLRRRIERAQELLLVPGSSVVDVALEVGFQTQSHFTSVFRRYVGQPPHAWRQGQDRGV